MASVFTKIMHGDLPGRFVWDDEVCAAFLSINPLQPGHVLVVPREETTHWIDLDDSTWAHLTTVAKTLGQALEHAYQPAKVGLMIAGLEVAHVHIHVVPINEATDLDFAAADPSPDAAALDGAQERILAALAALGHSPG